MDKVLIVNKFYYPRGGDCVCTINLDRLLQEHGHETAIYAMRYPENIESRWTPFFASEVSFGGGIKNLIAGMERTLGIGDIKASFKKILNDFKPDVVHLNNIHSYLSPVLAQLAHRAGARVVWTLHDYKLVCPSYSCLADGNPCEACIGGNKFNVVKKRCMKGSLAASVVAWLEAERWNRHVLEKSVDAFICPSEFMRSKMEQDGFSTAKLSVLCNFVDPVKLNLIRQNTCGEHAPGKYCYVGRLSREKGVEELLEVASQLPYTLLVAGDGPLRDELEKQYGGCRNIQFLGRLNATEVCKLLSSVYASIIPSRWYENNPLGVIESLCAGTPVVGAEIGGIPELIDNTCGATYRWNDKEAMKASIVKVMEASWDNNGISSMAKDRFSPESHYTKLMELYRGALIDK